MIMSAEDRRQETERIKLEHPEYLSGQIYRDLRDAEKSRAWVSVVYSKSFPTSGLDIDTLLDLRSAIAQLPETQRLVISLFLQGHRKKQIAEMIGYSQHGITNLYNKAIDRMRKILC